MKPILHTPTLQPLQLTAEQKESLQLAELSVNPADRLLSNYYSQTKRLLYDDYVSNINTNAERELIDLDLARENLNACLQKLNEDYVNDLQTWIAFNEVYNGFTPPCSITIAIAD